MAATIRRIELVSDLGEVFKYNMNPSDFQRLLENDFVHFESEDNDDIWIYYDNNKKLLTIEDLENDDFEDYNIVKFTKIVEENF